MEELLYRIFESDKRYLTNREIIKELLNLQYDDDTIKSAIFCSDESKMFINIDKYYSKLNKKQLKKLNCSEIVRYIIRNSEVYNYVDFNTCEYKYLKDFVKGELIKLEIPADVITECMNYIDNNSDLLYDGDRYIIDKEKENNTKIIYNKVLYKLRNIFILFDGKNIYYCVRKIVKKDDKLEFMDKKYYHDLEYEYYNLKDYKIICDSLSNDYIITPLISYKGMNKNKKIISFKDVEKKLNLKMK